MKKSQLAVQLYTVREFTKTAEELENTLIKIKAMGYDAVQVSGIGPIDPKVVEEITSRLGLTICATHVSYDRLLTDLAAVTEEHLLWKCKYVGLGSIPPRYRGTKEGYLAFATEAEIIAKKLQEAGLQFVYHNHHFEFEKYTGVTGMDLLFTSTTPSFSFELDTYWVQAGGANPVDWIRKLAGRLQVIHLKDMAILQDKQIFAEIGEGNLDWDAILKVCRETEVEWYVVEQDTCLGGPFESLKVSMAYLENKVIAE